MQPNIKRNADKGVLFNKINKKQKKWVQGCHMFLCICFRHVYQLQSRREPLNNVKRWESGISKNAKIDRKIKP